jgi:hypothetical protein
MGAGASERTLCSVRRSQQNQVRAQGRDGGVALKTVTDPFSDTAPWVQVPTPLAFTQNRPVKVSSHVTSVQSALSSTKGSLAQTQSDAATAEPQAPGGDYGPLCAAVSTVAAHVRGVSPSWGAGSVGGKRAAGHQHNAPGDLGASRTSMRTRRAPHADLCVRVRKVVQTDRSFRQVSPSLLLLVPSGQVVLLHMAPARYGPVRTALTRFALVKLALASLA